MTNPIKDIVRFNQEAGLLGKGYNDRLESSFQIEEALENFDLFDLKTTIDTNYSGENTPKAWSRLLINSCNLPVIENTLIQLNIKDVDRLDKACDATVFAIGSMAKLGLNPQQITRALNAVMSANFTKLGMPKDDLGKLTKPSDFQGPEPILQQILDECVS